MSKDGPVIVWNGHNNSCGLVPNWLDWRDPWHTSIGYCNSDWTNSVEQLAEVYGKMLRDGIDHKQAFAVVAMCASWSRRDDYEGLNRDIFEIERLGREMACGE